MYTAGGLFFVLCYEPESGKAQLATSRSFLFYENAQAYATTLSPSLEPFIVKKVMGNGSSEEGKQHAMNESPTQERQQ